MVQASNQSSRTLDGEARERLTDQAVDILTNGSPKGWFWCSERKDYFKYYDWINRTGKGKGSQ